MSETLTLTPDQLQAVIDSAVEKAVSKKRNDDFQPVWRVRGKNYASSTVTLPDGTKVWLNVFPNKFWKKAKKGEEQPLFRVTINPYTPKEKAKS